MSVEWDSIGTTGTSQKRRSEGSYGNRRPTKLHTIGECHNLMSAGAQLIPINENGKAVVIVTAAFAGVAAWGAIRSRNDNTAIDEHSRSD